jgi:hypothetical protein
LAVVGAAWIYLLICKWPGELGFVLAFAMILTWPLGLIALAIIPLVSALRRRWYEAGSWLVGALIVFALWRPMMDSCDYAHLLIMLPFYSAKVAAAPNDHGRELVVDDWSVGLAFTPSIFLVYDDSGRITRPISRQAPPLTNLGGLETDCSGQAQPLMLHYYLCDVD